ncbi:MAG: zinc ribbon domain-containing protein [Anaerolineaceae bacterium]|jgi:biopolymer transport protein ExbB/TolQ|nr:zinc ribbon domain-containing protein [Anaerolineaceae bacterium]
MSDFINIPVILFVVLFSLVAASLILIQITGISKADRHIFQSEQHQQQYQNLLAEINSLENKYPLDSTPEEIYQQIEMKRRKAAKVLQLINPGLDERLSFYQVDDDLGQLQDRKDRETQQLDNIICQNCGSKVHGGDKFCANCGFRLQG